MAVSKSAWGIDIGQCALKALRLRDDGDGPLQVDAYEVIEHASVLSQPDVDAPALIRASLDEFLRRQNVGDATVAVSLLGRGSFTKYVKLPPVEKKRVPEIVRFEAEQQIPFPINEVIWRYHTFEEEDSPEVEVGIFAMKQVDVSEMLSYFVGAGLDVDLVQMAPLSLYNFMLADGQTSLDGATILADVGADKTHLVVADGNRIWTRTINIGGNDFTEALVESFKLSFAKAEKLKCTAAQSKYARQIFQVMRPVFAKLVLDIQRSIGYYTSLHRNARFVQLVGMGNGFKLPGMQKYLEQNLNMAVKRVDEFQQVPSPTPAFAEFAQGFGVAYGLAAQAMNRAPVRTNLLPEAIVKKRLWGKKNLWFTTAAAALVIATGLSAFCAQGDLFDLQTPTLKRNLSDAREVIDTLTAWKDKGRDVQGELKEEESLIQKNLDMRAYSKTWPEIRERIDLAVSETLVPSRQDRDILKGFLATPAAGAARDALVKRVESDQALLAIIGMLPYEVSDPTAPKSLRDTLLGKLQGKKRTTRSLMVLDRRTSKYSNNLSEATTRTTAASRGIEDRPRYEGDDRARYEDEGRSARQGRSPQSSPTAAGGQRGFQIVLAGRTPLPRGQAGTLVGNLMQELRKQLNANGMFQIVGEIESEYPQNAKPESERTGGRGDRYRPRGVEASRVGTKEPVVVKVIDPDPLFPRESMANDTRFELTIQLEITGNGLPKPASDESEKKEKR